MKKSKRAIKRAKKLMEARKKVNEHTCPFCKNTKYFDKMPTYPPVCDKCSNSRLDAPVMRPSKNGKINEITFYRYEGYEDLTLEEFKVVRFTKRGLWICPKEGYGYPEEERWISGNARKTFAHPTKEQALTSYRIRKSWQLKHLQRMTELAEAGYRNAAEIQGLPPVESIPQNLTNTGLQLF